MRPTPLKEAPELEFKILGGESWNLKNAKPERFNLIVFYRGLHCPVCKRYLQQLESMIANFKQLGVEVTAVSMDTEKRARLSRKDWELKELQLGFELDSEIAKNWGLYFSKGVKKGEPELFSEPGLFLVDNEHKIYYSAINSNPWGRPYLPSFIKAVDYIIETGYPARGEHTF